MNKCFNYKKYKMIYTILYYICIFISEYGNFKFIKVSKNVKNLKYHAIAFENVAIKCS